MDAEQVLPSFEKDKSMEGSSSSKTTSSSTYLATNMTSPYIDIDLLEESWANLNYFDPMMTCIDPNLICPTEIIIPEDQNQQQQLQQQQTQQIHLQMTSENQSGLQNQYQYQYQNIIAQQPALSGHEGPKYNIKESSRRHKELTTIDQNLICPTEIIIPQQQIQQQQLQLQISSENHSGLQNQNQYHYQYQTIIEPPPTLARHEEPKYCIKESLRRHRELTKQRQEKIKARLEKQPAQLPADLLRRGISAKKLTGRERQLELERQEAQQLKLRDHYLKTINQLEAKCNKLREILENIVTTSPDYNNQMMIYLETERLMRLDEQD